MRLTIRQDQMAVMQAVAETNFERQIAAQLRGSYADSVVKLPDNGGEHIVSALSDDDLERWVRAGIAKARDYELQIRSSIAAFVVLMFDVAPNFDGHRLCEVLLGDEDRTPDERVDDVLTVLSEKNWNAIRNDYDPQAWLAAEQIAIDAAAKQNEPTEGEMAKAAGAGSGDFDKTVPGKTLSGKSISGKTLKGKTLSGKTFARTLTPRSQTVKVQPETTDIDPELDSKTVKIAGKE